MCETIGHRICVRELFLFPTYARKAYSRQEVRQGGRRIFKVSSSE